MGKIVVLGKNHVVRQYIMKFPSFNLLKYIHLPIFLISFLMGVVLVYYYIPQTRHIYVYPTPENIDVLQYQDKTDGCFEFEKKEVTCPADKSQIEQVPFQM